MVSYSPPMRQRPRPNGTDANMNWSRSRPLLQTEIRKVSHPFYQWSMLFFIITYLLNHTRTFGSFGSFAPRRRANRRRGFASRPAAPGIGQYDPAIDISTIKQPELSSLGLVGSSDKPTIAVATCASSRNWEHLHFDAMSLARICVPSLIKTMETDRFQYKLFVGIDDTDKFWNTRSNQEKLRKLAGDKLDVYFYSFPQPLTGHRIPLNEICREAYDYGADYIVRINDDTEFLTPYWASLGMKKLRSFDPPNVGVVGPTCYQGNLEILTHDMVHRTHVDIFKTYYPPDFKNWYVDDWITLVYGKDRTRVLGKWEVKHHIGYHGTRYAAHTPDLDGAVASGKRALQEWLSSGKSNGMPSTEEGQRKRGAIETAEHMRAISDRLDNNNGRPANEGHYKAQRK